jgi:nicotinic acid mononucleotide adenylyltransferase
MLAQHKLRMAHDFPVTKVLFMPSTSSAHKDLLATSSDRLRIWQLTNEAGTNDKVLTVCPCHLPAAVMHINW